MTLVLAHRLHANQVRKVSGVPCMAHLLAVTALVLEDGGTEDEAIAALLHDVIEDQGGETIRAEIEQQFGEAVVVIVEGCTEFMDVPKPCWFERKQRYLLHLQQAFSSVRWVSLADKLHNACSLLVNWQRYGDRVWYCFNAMREEVLWFFRSLGQIYRRTGWDWMTHEFDRVISALVRQAK